MCPTEAGGGGASAADAVRVIVGLSSLSPSLAVAAANHHFTVAQLRLIDGPSGRLHPTIAALMAEIPRSEALVASGWSEGAANHQALVPVASSVADGDDLIISGIKRPCSMAHSMGILTASLAVDDPSGVPVTALAVVPANLTGIRTSTTWMSDLLAAAENDEVVLDRVRVPRANVIMSTASDPTLMDDLLAVGFAWYELLITSAYAGAAVRVVQYLVDRELAQTTETANAIIGVRSSVALLEGLADRLEAEPRPSTDLVNDVLIARYAVQRTFVAVTDRVVEVLGGSHYARIPEAAYLASVCRLLAFHTPARSKMEQSISDFARGQELTLA